MIKLKLNPTMTLSRGKHFRGVEYTLPPSSSLSTSPGPGWHSAGRAKVDRRDDTLLTGKLLTPCWHHWDHWDDTF